jgi:hypothetical protein
MHQKNEYDRHPLFWPKFGGGMPTIPLASPPLAFNRASPTPKSLSHSLQERPYPIFAALDFSMLPARKDEAPKHHWFSHLHVGWAVMIDDVDNM